MKKNNIIENIVVVVIFLVLIQTFIEDLAVIAGWSWNVRKLLVMSGFFFDLFFTVEFLARLFKAMEEGRVREYIVLRRGWIDLLASIPLLLLNSGPSVIAIILGGGAVSGGAGILNVLKVLKAVRIARILRLLRVLKIVKQIKNADSVMAQRHVAKIATQAVSVFVFVLLAASIFTQILPVPTAVKENEKKIIDVMIGWNGGSAAAESYSDLLIVKKNAETLFTRYDNSYYEKNFGYSDYLYAEYMGFEFFFDMRGIEKLQSVDNLIYFFIILALVLVFTFVYSPHFAMTISDPIHVMRRGLDEKSYNYEVKILNEFADDDVFKLSKSYNDVYLPMKDRDKSGDSGIDADSLELKMDDIQNLL